MHPKRAPQVAEPSKPGRHPIVSKLAPWVGGRDAAGVMQAVQAELNQPKTLLALLILTALLAGCSTRNSNKSALGSAGVCFIGLTNLGEFARSEGDEASVVWTSSEVATPFPWKELVVSWNVEL